MFSTLPADIYIALLCFKVNGLDLGVFSSFVFQITDIVEPITATALYRNAQTYMIIAYIYCCFRYNVYVLF